jgi:hypothetical protein
MEDLQNENNKLKRQLKLLRKKKNLNNLHIDGIFDEWYSSYKREDFNIFAFELPIIGKIDLLPESIEKHIYKNMIRISLFMLSKINIDMMGLNINFTLTN